MSIINTKGVDISDWQGDIDLSAVKAAGYSWVMIRCGQGTWLVDKYWEDNVRKAEALGMPWGVYLLTEATTAAKVQAEVDFADKLIKAQMAKGYKPLLPIAIDIERAGYNSDDYTAKNLTAAASGWIQGMKKLGYYPMIYTGYYELRDYISSDVVNSTDVWLAQYNSYPDYTKSNLGLWQYGGSINYIESPYISGVSGAIDKDKAYKDYPTIIKNGGFNGWGTPSGAASDDGISVQHIIDAAYALLNVDEHPDSCDIMHWYGSFSDDINDVACCCAGMMYLFHEAGALDLIPGGKVADCGSLCRNFYEADQLYGPDEVKPGDLVIFSWSKERSSYWPASSLGYKTLDHVEFCVAVYDDTIKCIGANNGGAECDDFQIKTRDRSNISCCCRPDYNNSSVISYTEDSYAIAENGSSVSSVQSWLNLSYNTGLDVDGIYGPLTRAALVKALQTELNVQFGAGLAVDGIYGPQTAAAVVCVYIGAQGNITKTLQGFLICNGYTTNGFDGIFGNGTQSAVKAFQMDNSAAVDGIAGPETWRLLAESA